MTWTKPGPGRPRIWDDVGRARIADLYDAGRSMKWIADLLGTSTRNVREACIELSMRYRRREVG